MPFAEVRPSNLASQIREVLDLLALALHEHHFTVVTRCFALACITDELRRMSIVGTADRLAFKHWALASRDALSRRWGGAGFTILLAVVAITSLVHPLMVMLFMLVLEDMILQLHQCFEERTLVVVVTAMGADTGPMLTRLANTLDLCCAIGLSCLANASLDQRLVLVWRRPG